MVKFTVANKRAGNAGLIAICLIAFAGIGVGAVSAYIGEHGSAARALRLEAINVALRDEPLSNAANSARDEIVRRVMAGEPTKMSALERFAPPAFTPLPGKPKIIIIFDDMGVNKRAFNRVMNLPGPLTHSFLPYAKDVAQLAARADAKGDAIMLHLPMQPKGGADPGPHALRMGMTGASFLRALDWNLTRFDGYVGVNNHMGSLLTQDEAAMKTTLSILKHNGVFFLDSLTTGSSVAREAGAIVGAQVFARDVFLDADSGKGPVIKQLALVEEIAVKTGYAVAIAHPRKETLDVIGPWLTSAPARGFELATVTALVEMEQARRALEDCCEYAPPILRDVNLAVHSSR